MSDLKILQERVLTLAKARGHNNDPKIILLFLLEELGEVTRAYLKEEGHKGDNTRVIETFKQEIGDVFFLLLQLSGVCDVDLEKQLDHTTEKLKNRSISD